MAAYGYSPIKSIRIKNFKSIGDIMLDFTLSPIVTLTGESEVGKTSIIKAMAVAFLHAKPLKQKGYIRDFTKGFGIETELMDGTVITRMKTATVNSYRVARPGHEVWSTTKIDKEGLPVMVQEVMGLIEEPETKEFLHIRTYADMLLFVLSKGSTNYKVMYNALKVENITGAIKLGSAKVNDLRRQIAGNESSITTLSENIKKMVIPNIEPLVIVKNRLIQTRKQAEMLVKIAALVERNEMLRSAAGIYSQLEGIHEISEWEGYQFTRLGSLVESVEAQKQSLGCLKYIESISAVPESTGMERIVSLINRNEALRESIGSLSLLENAAEVKAEGIGQLERLVALIQRTEELKSNTVDTGGAEEISMSDIAAVQKSERLLGILEITAVRKKEYEEYRQKEVELNGIISRSGALVAECPNCGEPVVMLSGES